MLDDHDELFDANAGNLDIIRGEIDQHVRDGMGWEILRRAHRDRELATLVPVVREPTTLFMESNREAASRAALDLAILIARLEGLPADEPMADLYAHAMEAINGTAYSFLGSAIRVGDAMCIVDSHHGRFGPQMFIQRVAHASQPAVFWLGALVLTGVSDADVAALLGDPGSGAYDNAWDNVESHGVLTDGDGVHYTISYSNGDAWAIPEMMEWSDEEDWYVWPEGSIAPTDSPVTFGRWIARLALGTKPLAFGELPLTEGDRISIGAMSSWAKRLYDRFALALYDQWKAGATIFRASFDGETLTWSGEVSA